MRSLWRVHVSLVLLWKILQERGLPVSVMNKYSLLAPRFRGILCAYWAPLLYFLDGVLADVAEVWEVVAFSLRKVEADPLLAHVDFAEDVFALLVHINEDLLDALSRLELNHADRAVALA